MRNFLSISGICIIALTVLSCWSSTGDIEYKPDVKSPGEKRINLTHTIAVLDFPDQRFSIKKFRSKKKGSLIGVFYGGYKNPFRKIYNSQSVTDEVTDTLVTLFTASGFRVRKYKELSDMTEPLNERVVVKGQVREFFLHSYPGLRSTGVRLEARIDIDLVIFDIKEKRNIWAGKIINVQEMPKHKGTFTRTRQIFSFMNMVLSKGISDAWTNQGMSKALTSLE